MGTIKELRELLHRFANNKIQFAKDVLEEAAPVGNGRVEQLSQVQQR